MARDAFTCRYCGQKAPDVQLQVDHIHPRALGGNDEAENLITACFDCNMGKRDLLMAPELIARVTPTSAVPDPPARKRSSVREVIRDPVTGFKAWMGVVQAPPERDHQYMPWGIGRYRPHQEPAWRCSQCGMICLADGDVCSCDRDRSRVPRCDRCEVSLADMIEGYGGSGMCEDCEAAERWRWDEDDEASG